MRTCPQCHQELSAPAIHLAIGQIRCASCHSQLVIAPASAAVVVLLVVFLSHITFQSYGASGQSQWLAWGSVMLVLSVVLLLGLALAAKLGKVYARPWQWFRRRVAAYSVLGLLLGGVVLAAWQSVRVT